MSNKFIDLLSQENRLLNLVKSFVYVFAKAQDETPPLAILYLAPLNYDWVPVIKLLMFRAECQATFVTGFNWMPAYSISFGGDYILLD